MSEAQEFTQDKVEDASTAVNKIRPAQVLPTATQADEREGEDFQISWRRAKVMEGLAMGKTQREIARELKVHESTISRDVTASMLEAVSKKESFGDKLLKEQLKVLTGLDLTLQELWSIVETSNDAGERMQALAQITKVYQQRLEVTSGKFLRDIATFNPADMVESGKPLGEPQFAEQVQQTATTEVAEA